MNNTIKFLVICAVGIIALTGCSNNSANGNTEQTEVVEEDTEDINANQGGEEIDFYANHTDFKTGELVKSYTEIPFAPFSMMAGDASTRLGIWYKEGCQCNNSGMVPVESFHTGFESSPLVGITVGTDLQAPEDCNNCVTLIYELTFNDGESVTTYVPVEVYNVTDTIECFTDDMLLENKEVYTVVNGHKYWGFESISDVNDYLKEKWKTDNITYTGK